MSINEAERLTAYYPFDDDVLARVATVAEHQRGHTWAELKAQLPEIQTFIPSTGKPLRVVDVIPSEGYDSVQVFHLPMGCGLDDNMLVGVATLAAAEPNKRLVVASNPGGFSQSSGKIPLRDFGKVWRGNMEPVIDPLLQYLSKHDINEAVHIGGSAGAERATALAHRAADYGHRVSHLVVMEPPSVVRRSLVGLAQRFISSGKPLSHYVHAAQSPAYLEAREPYENFRSLASYFCGLLRTTNIATAHALAQEGFEDRVSAALDVQKDMCVDIIWGSESELATHGAMLEIGKRLVAAYGKDRVQATAIKGHTHAMPADLFFRLL